MALFDSFGSMQFGGPCAAFEDPTSGFPFLPSNPSLDLAPDFAAPMQATRAPSLRDTFMVDLPPSARPEHRAAPTASSSTRGSEEDLLYGGGSAFERMTGAESYVLEGGPMLDLPTHPADTDFDDAAAANTDSLAAFGWNSDDSFPALPREATPASTPASSSTATSTSTSTSPAHPAAGPATPFSSIGTASPPPTIRHLRFPRAASMRTAPVYKDAHSDDEGNSDTDREGPSGEDSDAEFVPQHDDVQASDEGYSSQPPSQPGSPAASPSPRKDKDKGGVSCEFCLVTFATNYAMHKHRQREHYNQMPYECNLCSKRFSKPGSLLRHRGQGCKGLGSAHCKRNLGHGKAARRTTLDEARDSTKPY